MGKRNYTRRNLIKSSGLGFGAALAGCIGGDDDETPTQGGQGGNGTPTQGNGQTQAEPGGLNEAVEPVLDLPGTHPSPADIKAGPLSCDANEASPAANGWQVGTVMPPDANRYPQEPNPDNNYPGFLPFTHKRVELDESSKVITWELSDYDFTWHNGEEVNIYDRWYDWDFNYKLYEEKTDQEHGFESAEVLDDQTMRIELKEPVHPGLIAVAGNATKPRITAPRWMVKPYHEELEDTSNTSAAEDVWNRFHSDDPPVVDLEKWVGNGIFQVESVNDQTAEYTLYEDHPWIDGVETESRPLFPDGYIFGQNIEKLRIHGVGGEAAERLMWQDGQLDAGTLPPGNVQLPADINTFGWKSYDGRSLQFNMHNEHLDKREVRRAIAYWLDPDSLVNNFDPSAYFPEHVQTGVTEPVADDWLPWDKSEMNAYGPGRMEERAVELMNEAGYSRNDDGMWEDENGDVLSFYLLNTVEDFTQVLVDSLTRFGFEMSSTVSWDKWWGVDDLGPPYPPTGEDGFDLRVGLPSTESNLPIRAYINHAQGLPLAPEIEDSYERGIEEDAHYMNRPWEITVPETMGDLEVSGSGKDLDLISMQEELSDPEIPVDDISPLAEDFARYWHYDLSGGIVFATVRTGYSADVENFVWSDASGNGQPGYQSAYMPPLWRGLQAGWVRGVSE